MGSNVSLQPTKEQLLTNYALIYEQNSLKILQDKRSQETFALKELSFIVKKQYDEQFLRLTKKQQRQQSENVLQLVKLWTRQHNGICSNLFKIYTVYQYPRVKLLDEIEARQMQLKFFEEMEIFSILQSCICALRSTRVPISISPQNVFIVPDGLLKVINSDLLNSQHQVSYDKNFYYSPEKIANFSNSNHSEQALLKEAIFSLGMTLLHATILTKLTDCYDLPKQCISQTKLEQYITKISPDYSRNLRELLQTMLTFDPQIRIDLNSIQGAINNYFLNKSKSLVDEQNEFKNIQLLSCNSACSRKSRKDVKTCPISSAFSNSLVNARASDELCPRQRQSAAKIVTNPTNENLPKSPTIFLKSKQRSKKHSLNENIYTDPKMLDFIAEDGFCPQRPVERKPLADSMDTQRYDDNRISFESVQQMRGKGSRDYLSEYDLLTSQKKCMYVMETYNDGSRYQGMAFNGEKNGYGTLWYADGAYYEGNFKENKIHGRGTLYYGKDRPAYCGDWEDQLFHGNGTLYNEYSILLDRPFDYHNFNKIDYYWLKYEGNFLADHKDGIGKLVLTNGEQIQGMFHNNKLNGQCIFTTLDGHKLVGQWQDNILQSS